MLKMISEEVANIENSWRRFKIQRKSIFKEENQSKRTIRTIKYYKYKNYIINKICPKIKEKI